MKFALVQPGWEFQGSTYFGCPETHLPLELFFARQHLEAAGHETLLLDAHLEHLSREEAGARVQKFQPDFLVLTTAPTYLFWRCPQPELRLPARWMHALRRAAPSACAVGIGPHGSATPAATLRKLDCDLIIQGEADAVLPQLVDGWTHLAGCAWREADCIRVNPGHNQADLGQSPALDLGRYPLQQRRHRHHVFHGAGRGGEVEASRGCPWACTFCNKTLFRNQFRARPVESVTAEVEALARAGLDYIYFIDEIFGCARSTPELLQALTELPVSFGIQTRIDLWNEDTLADLGAAGCVSLECGIESVTRAGRARFRKGCKLDNDRISDLLRTARRHIPWVQANLIADDEDDLDAIAAWRAALISDGVWVSQPVPVFAFPGTPLYQKMFGPPDDQAWERAHQHYLAVNRARGYYSDIQDQQPQPLAELES